MNKTAAVLISLSILTFTATTFAMDATTSTTTRSPLPTRKPLPQIVDTRKQTSQQMMEEMKEKIASRQAELRTKLETFKDQRKAQSVDRINTNLSKINKIMADNFSRFLKNLTSILDKLEGRVNSNTPDIKDSTKAKQAISSAREAIASASAAIATQSAKDYTIHVSTESAVKSDAKKTREQLYSDLQGLRKLLTSVKQAVANAIRVAKSGKLEIPGKEASKEASESGR